MKSIMFVCSGNICRSPMAHSYMQKKLKDLNREKEYIISSCGTYAIQGQNATNYSIEAMKKYEVDLTKHKATRMQDSNIQNYDLVFALTNNHKTQILKIYPSLNGKVFTLKEYVNTSDLYKDIDDPWGLDLNVYIETAKDIVINIDKLLEMI